MATIKRLSQFLNSSALRSEKHHQVVKHIGGFIHHATVGAIGGLYHRFDSLLSHFLRHSVNQANRKAHDKDTPQAPELTEIGESDGIGQYSSRVISILQAPSGLKLSIKKNRHGANNKNLTYCWDIDRGTFDFLPTPREDEDDNSTQDSSSARLQVRNRRGRQQQQEQFNDGSDVF